MVCPLCNYEETKFHEVSKLRPLFFCPQCFLLFVSQNDQESSESEKARYEEHQNHPEGKGFEAYSAWMEDFVSWGLSQGAQGEQLDFGSGPYPLLTKKLQARGENCVSYDPYFAPQREVLERCYETIWACEVVEHFKNPLEDWKNLLRPLKKGGKLFIRTQTWSESLNLSSWAYLRDRTHVAFYHEKTMAFLEKKFALRLIARAKDKFYFVAEFE